MAEIARDYEDLSRAEKAVVTLYEERSTEGVSLLAIVSGLAGIGTGLAINTGANEFLHQANARHSTTGGTVQPTAPETLEQQHEVAGWSAVIGGFAIAVAIHQAVKHRYSKISRKLYTW
jgi:hypothetical protein